MPSPTDLAPSTPKALPTLLLPSAPVLVAGLSRSVWLTPDGEVEEMDNRAVLRRLGGQVSPIVCHMRATARRLGGQPFPALDLLELFAFVRPATPCLPTPRGLASALELDPPKDRLGEAAALVDALQVLLAQLARHPREGGGDGDTLSIAKVMGDAGWPWAPFVMAALSRHQLGARGLAVWRGLPEISDHAPEPPSGHLPVDATEARARLAKALGQGGGVEARPSQGDYASAAALAFQPRDVPGEPHLVLAEAGTGIGKTLGYLAPATVWAEKNQGAVWVSTYTRNLQHQIDSELDRIYPDPGEKVRSAVLRKGRENYLCLLNLEEAVGALGARPVDGVALGLMARWVAATRDGDLSGPDFPGWLPELIGRPRTHGLADRRGECIYSACQHFDRCFVERSIRRARRARIVVANHALVMIQAALNGEDDQTRPTRLVFDEGHHVFDAADSAFSAALSAVEALELRRWLLGAEGGRGRARGLRRRVEELLPDEKAAELLDQALRAARALPAEGWPARLAGDIDTGSFESVGGPQPNGPVEAFLKLVRQQLLARTPGGADGRAREGLNLETETTPPIDGIAEAAEEAAAALARIREPLLRLKKTLLDRLEDEAEDLETATRQRIEAVSRSLDRRAILPIGGWIAMLQELGRPTPAEFVDWFELERLPGGERGEIRDMDVGMHRHWIDPTVPFATAVAAPAHGLIVTSATLTDGSGDATHDWQAAEARTGALHLPNHAIRAALASPFDYPARTRVFIVTDVRKDDLRQVAAAYRALFLASGGGALGLFTAISRLRAVHGVIARDLETAGIPLLAQHVDGMEVSSLIDIFRAEEDACLLGTDAVRDGVDVPGRALRLIVFDRVPWPRPDILHKARRNAFGGRGYDDMLTRLKLKQAFGRLIRRADDTGVFVLLDPMMPTRLTTAFPPGVEVARVGLADAVAETKAFLASFGHMASGAGDALEAAQPVLPTPPLLLE